MRQIGPLLVAGLLLAGCGSGGDDAAAPADDPCPRVADVETRVSLQWTGPWDQKTARAAIARWDDTQPNIAVDLRDQAGFFDGALALLGDDPPTIASVSFVALPALVAAGAIRPVGPCLASLGVDFDGMLPQSVVVSEVHGVGYGAPSALDPNLMVYDRNAFRRAGLDPDAPPRTLDELRVAAIALRDKAGYEHPIVWDFGQLAILGLDIRSADARTAAQQWTQLGVDGLLLPPGPEPHPLPPIGSGEAAIQHVGMGDIWGLASSLADGQAPGADLAIMAMPGLRAPAAPAGGGVWVISSKATPAQAAAAAHLVAWAEEPAQQARLHVLSDFLPVSAAAAHEQAVVEHWSALPLLGQAWDVMSQDAVTIDGWERVFGSYVSIGRPLGGVAFDGRPFAAAWDHVIDLMTTAERLQLEQPVAFVRCLADNVTKTDDPVAVCA